MKEQSRNGADEMKSSEWNEKRIIITCVCFFPLCSCWWITSSKHVRVDPDVQHRAAHAHCAGSLRRYLSQTYEQFPQELPTADQRAKYADAPSSFKDVALRLFREKIYSGRGNDSLPRTRTAFRNRTKSNTVTVSLISFSSRSFYVSVSRRFSSTAGEYLN